MNQNTYIALDLGSSRITAMAAEVLDSGAVKVLATEWKAADDVYHGIIEHTSGAAFKISELLKLLQNSAKIRDFRQVCVALNAKSMKLFPSSTTQFIGQGKIVTDELLDEMKEECERKNSDENNVVFDVFPVSFEIDGKTINDPLGQSGNQITGNYHIVKGNARILQQLKSCFIRNQIQIEYAPLSVEALSTVLTEEEERQNGCALIDFGDSTTTLAVYKNDVLQELLVVPLGSKNITYDIAELGIEESNAERLKCLTGVAMEKFVEKPVYVQVSPASGTEPVKISTLFLAQIINARLDEMTEPIFKVLEDLSYPLESGIIITGGGARLKFIKEFVEEKTGLNVRWGNHSDWLDEGTPDYLVDSSFSQLIGTVLLANENRRLHPLESETATKKGQKNKKKITERITDGFLRFFDDETNWNK
jgi:cell division protein FtsA